MHEWRTFELNCKRALAGSPCSSRRLPDGCNVTLSVTPPLWHLRDLRTSEHHEVQASEAVYKHVDLLDQGSVTWVLTGRSPSQQISRKKGALSHTNAPNGRKCSNRAACVLLAGRGAARHRL